MAQTQPPSIDPVPTPPIQRGDRTTFSSRVDAFIRWLVNAVTQFQAVASNVYNNAVDAYNNSRVAAQAATSATTDAANASRDAQTAAMAPGTSATSTTSMAIGFGSKTFTLAQTGKLFKKGNTVNIATSAAGNNWMNGPITAFDPSSGVMTVNVTNFTGSGTFADWVISLSGAAGLTGVVNEMRSTDVPSSSAISLVTPNGNYIHITGSATINAFNIPVGAERSLVFDGSPTLVNTPVLQLPTGANITAAPGDRALVRGENSGSIVTHYQRANGLALRSGAFDLVVPTTVISTSVANVDFLSFITGDYDKYLVEIQGVKLSVAGALQVQFAVNGTVDVANNYRNENAQGNAISTALSLIANDNLGANVSLELKNTNSTGLKSVNYVVSGMNNSGSYATAAGERTYIGNSPVSGIRLMSAGSTITQATIRIYGLKNIL